ncbi:hypothetical protein [Zavarzinia sp.]|uniref:hypothetical protein n=1 Tax=Zavarzinia sp. TaxID=2027920 RepID=UPI003566972C
MARRRSVFMAAAIAAICLATPAFAQRGGGGGAAGGTGGTGGTGTVGDQEPGDQGGSVPSGGAAARPSADAAVRSARDEAARGFAKWLVEAPEMAAYRGVAEDIKSAAAPAIAAGVPAGAFTARIREAAARGTAPVRLVPALESDARNWTYLSGLLDGARWPPAKATTGFYLAAGTAMRNGLGDRAVKAAVGWAISASADADRAGSAMMATAAVAAALGMPDGAAASFVVALASSRLPVAEFDGVAALASRAAGDGIPADRFSAAVTAALPTADGLAAVERALYP